MTLLEKLEMIQRIDGLIRRKATGTPCQLASKLNISERAVFRLITIMKKMDAPVTYSSIRNSYIYKYEVDLSIGFIPQNVQQDKIIGGKSVKKPLMFLDCHFLAVRDNMLVSEFGY